jgi:glucose-6-phosphate isomerase
MINKIYFEDLPNIKEAKKNLCKAIMKEKESVGYYNLPQLDVSSIDEFESSIDDKIEFIVVLGIGGSSLGAKAIYEFLKPVKEMKRKLYFFESTDPLNILQILSKIEMEKSHFLVISKSGTTVETIAVFKYLLSINRNMGHYTIITDLDSPLDKFGKVKGMNIFYLPCNVGGRFSVLSTVGLLPLALCGVDIKELLSGAKKIQNSFFDDGYIKDILLKKAFYYAKHHSTYHINCIFAYSETLKYFCQWYVQLWGESLGKKQRHSAFNVGLTPIGLIGPKDQHSFLQLIVEGTRDKSMTFIKIDDFKDDLSIPDISLEHLESLDILNGLEFHDLINMQCDSVLESLMVLKDIPLDEIIVPRVDERSMGELIYYYELLTSLVGQLIDVDTYNQPGVELGKIILKNKLSEVKK